MIYLNKLLFKDLPKVKAQIKDLEKSIAKFITIYSLKNLAQDKNPHIKILKL
jgi:hypothetical protein